MQAKSLARSSGELLTAVETIENEMKQMPQVEMRLEHHFAKGLYARELHIPAGTLLTGKIHKYEQINILSKGQIRVLTQNGIVEVSAPFIVVSPPGTKRIALAITDCVWITVLPTDEKDPQAIEDQFTCATVDEYNEFCKQIEHKECPSLPQQ